MCLLIDYIVIDMLLFLLVDVIVAIRCILLSVAALLLKHDAAIANFFVLMPICCYLLGVFFIKIQTVVVLKFKLLKNDDKILF